jgi:hypothetical protein
MAARVALSSAPNLKSHTRIVKEFQESNMNVNREGPTVGKYRVDVVKTVSNWRPEPQAGGLPK